MFIDLVIYLRFGATSGILQGKSRSLVGSYHRLAWLALFVWVFDDWQCPCNRNTLEGEFTWLGFLCAKCISKHDRELERLHRERSMFKYPIVKFVLDNILFGPSGSF